MTTDDIQDLFDSGGSDESDGPEEPDDADGSGERAGSPLFEDDESAESADSTGDGTVESTSPAETAEDDLGEFEPAASTGTSEGAAEDGFGEFERDRSTPTAEASPAADTKPETTGSATRDTGGAAEDDANESGTTGSRTSHIEDHTDESATPGSSATPGRPVDADAGEPEPTEPPAAPEGSVEANTGESGSPEQSTTSVAGAVEDATPESAPSEQPPASAEESVVDETRDTESAEQPPRSAEDDGREPGPAEQPRTPAEADTESAPSTTTREEAAASKRAGTGSGEATASPDTTTTDPRGESGSRESTVSAGGRTTGDRGTSESATATTSAEGTAAADDDEFETASPDESGPRTSGTADDDGAAAPASGSNRLPTGIDELDRAMGGGVPPGRLVVLVADPGVQSELIVDSILAQRDTLFVTTDRPDWEVQKDIEPGLGSGEVVIRDHSPDSLLSGLDSLLDELGTTSNFVLDSVNELELVPRKRYRVFLSDVKRRLFDTGSIGLLTGVTVGHESARDLTLRRADIVLRLETRTTDREIVNLLTVPKFRGGAAMTETVKLELTDEVRVDTSWNDG